MADQGLLSGLSQLLSDPGYAAMGFANGAKSFGDNASWILGGMNGPAPPIYAGGLTPNQYVSHYWPRANNNPFNPNPGQYGHPETFSNMQDLPMGRSPSASEMQGGDLARMVLQFLNTQNR